MMAPRSLGFKLRVKPKKKGEGVASQDLELPLEGAPQEAARSEAVGSSSADVPVPEEHIAVKVKREPEELE